MLTFTYNGYRVHINNAGNAEYVRLDPNIGGNPVVTNDPPAAIVTLAGQILQLVATDTLRAEMTVAGVREDLRIAMNDVESAASSEYEARIAGRSAMATRLKLAGQLKKAEDVLQSAKAE